MWKVVNWVMREWEYGPYKVIHFPVYFESTSRNEMPQESVTIWIPTRVVFDGIHSLIVESLNSIQ